MKITFTGISKENVVLILEAQAKEFHAEAKRFLAYPDDSMKREGEKRLVKATGYEETAAKIRLATETPVIIDSKDEHRIEYALGNDRLFIKIGMKDNFGREMDIEIDPNDKRIKVPYFSMYSAYKISYESVEDIPSELRIMAGLEIGAKNASKYENM